MLKKRLKALDEVDAQFRTAYEKQSDGFFHLKLEPEDDGSDEDQPPSRGAAKLDEFRRANRQLMKELADLKTKFEGIDPESYSNAMKIAESAQNDRERELLKAGKFEDVLALRQSALTTKHAAELKKLSDLAAQHEKSATKFKAELRGDRVRAKLRAEADEMKLKLRPSAVPDFYRRGLDTFDLDENGELVALNGEDLRMNAENKPYSARDFIMEVVDTAPHLVEEASGADLAGGAARKGARRTGGVVEINRSDREAVRANIEQIAKGKVVVRPG